jgi:hypothetical protein
LICPNAKTPFDGLFPIKLSGLAARRNENTRDGKISASLQSLERALPEQTFRSDIPKLHFSKKRRLDPSAADSRRT